MHRVFTEDGRDLALKVQYPGVAKSINSDVDNMAMLMRLINLLPVEIDISGIVKEAKRQLHQEADYIVEAQYLRDYRKLVEDEPRFVVPGVHDDLTTRRILAMDYVDGLPLESISEDDVSQEEKRRRLRAVETLKEGIAAEINARLCGETLEVLVEDRRRGRWWGRTRTGKLALFDDEKDAERYAEVAVVDLLS